MSQGALETLVSRLYGTAVKMDPRHRRPPLVATRADDPKLSAKKGRSLQSDPDSNLHCSIGPHGNRRRTSCRGCLTRRLLGRVCPNLTTRSIPGMLIWLLARSILSGDVT